MTDEFSATRPQILSTLRDIVSIASGLSTALETGCEGGEPGALGSLGKLEGEEKAKASPGEGNEDDDDDADADDMASDPPRSTLSELDRLDSDSDGGRG
jgi:hypothetical protein